MIGWLRDLLRADVVAEAPARAEEPETLAKQLALVIDLNVCVGCHACVTIAASNGTPPARPARWPT